VVITISAGLAEANPAHCAIESLIAQADMALYASKRGGRNRATVFTAELEKHRMVTRALECDLATAIERDEMRLVYQPIVALDGSKCEVEALARWLHPVLGEISPNQFIAAAERTGQIVPVGRWIMERALSDLQAWPWLTLSINISPVQLQQEGFVSFMLQACRAHGVPAARLVLEVTESLSIERNYRAQTALELLRTSGFRIALDDFGTGYSSLGMIKAMQFDRIKLDRSLIAGLGSDAASDAVFGAAVAMARSLGTETVAEGISDADVLAQISEFGITHAQGYYYSRPLERAAVPGFYAAEASGLARVA
jgi:EAL domain-containing protein (putative c-di-GMP-specific phosphodiesterase class I)